MANFRNINMSFWEDGKVVDDFTPEDRYGFLYCMTNTHTNLCGCYEVSIRTISRELGYTEDAVVHLLKRLDSMHNVIRYDAKTKELLVINWAKYNWADSDKLNKPLLAEIRKIKSDSFRTYLADLYNARKTVTEPFVPEERKPKKPDEPRHKYGEYGWVKLSDTEYERLLDDLGQDELERCIRYVDESAQANSNRNKWTDWNLVVRKCHRDRWGIRPEPQGSGQRQSASTSAMQDLRTLHQMFGGEEG